MKNEPTFKGSRPSRVTEDKQDTPERDAQFGLTRDECRAIACLYRAGRNVDDLSRIYNRPPEVIREVIRTTRPVFRSRTG